MPTNRLHELNDRALWPVLDAPDDQSREAAVESLLVEEVRPVITAVLQRFRRTEPDLYAEDLEEIASLAAIRLVHKVRAAVVYEEHAINVLGDYLATLTYNALYDFRRRRYPERHRLKRNLRYLLTHDSAFALWESKEGAVAGLAGRKGQSPKLPAWASSTPVMREKSRPAEAVRAILGEAGHPVAFDALVDRVAELWEVRDAVFSGAEQAADERPDPLSTLEQREYLEKLWSEIRELPDNQRTALLLNLRDAVGANALTLFLLLNVAGVAEVARAAGLTEEELNELWEKLPLDDLTIAERLRLTRQQVINLRKSARTRLARRMGAWK